jgi:hypothetical protein
VVPIVVKLVTPLLLLTLHAGAAVILFDTFGPGDSFESTGPSTGVAEIAFKFQPFVSGTVTRVRTALAQTRLGGGHTAVISIYSDSSGLPGARLGQSVLRGFEDFGDPGASADDFLVSANFFGPQPKLVVGTTYWLALIGAVDPRDDSDLVWFGSGGQTEFAIRFPHITPDDPRFNWTLPGGSSIVPVVRLIDATADTPEPPTVLLFLGCIAGYAFVRRFTAAGKPPRSIMGATTR